MLRKGHDGWYRLVVGASGAGIRGAAVDAGTKVMNHLNQPAKVLNGEAPHKPEAEGYVSTNLGRHYAGVYGLRWEKTHG